MKLRARLSLVVLTVAVLVLGVVAYDSYQAVQNSSDVPPQLQLSNEALQGALVSGKGFYKFEQADVQRGTTIQQGTSRPMKRGGNYYYLEAPKKVADILTSIKANSINHKIILLHFNDSDQKWHAFPSGTITRNTVAIEPSTYTIPAHRGFIIISSEESRIWGVKSASEKADGRPVLDYSQEGWVLLPVHDANLVTEFGDHLERIRKIYLQTGEGAFDGTVDLSYLAAKRPSNLYLVWVLLGSNPLFIDPGCADASDPACLNVEDATDDDQVNEESSTIILTGSHYYHPSREVSLLEIYNDIIEAGGNHDVDIAYWDPRTKKFVSYSYENSDGNFIALDTEAKASQYKISPGKVVVIYSSTNASSTLMLNQSTSSSITTLPVTWNLPGSHFVAANENGLSGLIASNKEKIEKINKLDSSNRAFGFISRTFTPDEFALLPSQGPFIYEIVIKGPNIGDPPPLTILPPVGSEGIQQTVIEVTYDNDSCFDLSYDKFIDEDGELRNCPAGLFQICGDNEPQCQKCGTNQRFDISARSCVSCPAGTYSDGQVTSCR